jgi:hypothetical protein
MGSSTDDMPTSIAPVPANQDDAGVEWYVAIDGTQHGPFAYAELIRKLKVKEVIGRHYVWHDGMDGWKRIRELADFAAYLPQDKRKPPPPPPPAERAPEPHAGDDEGAKVVDFAQKRAERDRGKAAAGEAAEGAAPEAATTPAGQPLSRSDRVEQLDSVLNEALGIKGEGRTAQAAASSAKMPAGSIAPPTSGPSGDFGDFGGTGDSLPENLFDSVPRASSQEIVGREATRFFVAAAGVNSKKSRNKVGMVIGGTAAACLGVFFFLWATGTIQINIPGLGNPFASIGGQEPQLPSGEISEKDMEEIKKVWGERKARELERSGQVRVKGRPKGALAAAGPGSGGYVQDNAAGSDGHARRGDDNVEKFDLGGSNIGVERPPDAVLPMGPKNAEVPQVDQPDNPFPEAQVRALINEYGKKAVADCYRRELQGNSNLKGKLEVLMTLQPTGEVSKTSVETPSFKGTTMGECVARRLKDLRFPTFGGKAQQFVVPFVLQKGQSY